MPRSRIAIAMLIAAAALTAVSACSSTPMPANIAGAPPIDLPRFMGRWHVIARVPYFAERGHVASVDEYTLQPDGDIGVRYTYRKRFSGPQQSLESRATVKARTGNRQWTTRFFRVIPTRYRILEVAPDYSWALIDYPGRDLAWVFARAPVMGDALYQDLERRLGAYGVNVDKVRRVPQVADQVGKLGFEMQEQ